MANSYAIRNITATGVSNTGGIKTSFDQEVKSNDTFTTNLEVNNLIEANDIETTTTNFPTTTNINIPTKPVVSGFETIFNQLPPATARGGFINRIQNGVLHNVYVNDYKTVNFASCNPNKSIFYVQIARNNSHNNYSQGWEHHTGFYVNSFTATSAQFFCNAMYGNSWYCTIHWWLIEFNNNVTVQKGTGNTYTGQFTANYSSVNTGKTFVTANACLPNSNGSSTSAAAYGTSITPGSVNATQAVFYINGWTGGSSSYSKYYNWNVVTFP